jgi:hypothetical protein
MSLADYIVVDKVALGQVFSEHFGFPCQSSFHQLLHNHHHRSSGAGTIGQDWQKYQVDAVSPHPEKLKKKLNVQFACQESQVITDMEKTLRTETQSPECYNGYSQQCTESETVAEC